MTTSNVIDIKGAQAAPKNQRSRSETIIVTLDMVGKWLKPDFQRPLKVNAKVQQRAVEIRADEVIPGIITLGKLKSSTALYLVDGQHRIEAFKIADIAEAIADVRVMTFDNMAEMAQEYVELNSHLVNMGPDDILRGLESSSKALRKIRAECGYVGYDNIRRGTTSPIVGMSQLLRCWVGSSNETPNSTVSGRTAASISMEISDDEVARLIKFLHIAFVAWGREPRLGRLWSGLNLTMCMWLYRRLVLDRARGMKRYVVLSDNQFKQCLMSLSADENYVDWLPGRIMNERYRSPCYSHFRRIFAKRMSDEGIARPLMPSPAWANTGGVNKGGKK
jgi:hypothetical protein